MNSLWAEGKLFQGIVPTAVTKVYSPQLAKNGQVKIERIFIANDAVTAVKFALWSGATNPLAANIIFPHTTVQPNTLWVPSVILYLGFGESVWIVCDTANAVCLTLNGGVRQ